MGLSGEPAHCATSCRSYGAPASGATGWADAILAALVQPDDLPPPTPHSNRPASEADTRRVSVSVVPWLPSTLGMTRIMVMTTIPLADVKARLSAVLDEVRDTHERVVITRNGRPEAVILSVADLEALEETLDILSTPGALEQIRQAEDEIARGETIDADELHRLLADRRQREQAET